MLNIPIGIETERLRLRPWRAADAAALHPILATNWDHLGPWIPARVATPASVPELTERLQGFADTFTGDREWRYAIFSRAEDSLLGELSLFPRSPTSRAAFGDSDRVELGYWLRRDETGRGVITEGARALIDLARTFERFQLMEIRCDARNDKSSAIPRRLGFTLAETIRDLAEPDVALQVWSLALR